MVEVLRRLARQTVATGTLLTACCLSLPALADQDAKADLQERLAGMQQLTAEFAQTVRSDNGDVLQQLTGELAIERPNKMRWKTNPPDDTLMIANGETVWYYNPFVEQVTIYQQADATDNSPMLLLLTGTTEQWQDYQVSQSEPGNYQINANDGSSSLRLSFSDGRLRHIGLRQQQGDTIDIDLTQVELNGELPAATFEFAIPQGTDVDDQR